MRTRALPREELAEQDLLALPAPAPPADCPACRGRHRAHTCGKYAPRAKSPEREDVDEDPPQLAAERAEDPPQLAAERAEDPPQQATALVAFSAPPAPAADCPACRGRHRAHTCGKAMPRVTLTLRAQPDPPQQASAVQGLLALAAPPAVCLACQGRHRAHTCGKWGRSARAGHPIHQGDDPDESDDEIVRDREYEALAGHDLVAASGERRGALARSGGAAERGSASDNHGAATTTAPWDTAPDSEDGWSWSSDEAEDEARGRWRQRVADDLDAPPPPPPLPSTAHPLVRAAAPSDGHNNRPQQQQQAAPSDGHNSRAAAAAPQQPRHNNRDAPSDVRSDAPPSRRPVGRRKRHCRWDASSGTWVDDGTADVPTLNGSAREMPHHEQLHVLLPHLRPPSFSQRSATSAAHVAERFREESDLRPHADPSASSSSSVTFLRARRPGELEEDATWTAGEEDATWTAGEEDATWTAGEEDATWTLGSDDVTVREYAHDELLVRLRTAPKPEAPSNGGHALTVLRGHGVGGDDERLLVHAASERLTAVAVRTLRGSLLAYHPLPNSRRIAQVCSVKCISGASRAHLGHISGTSQAYLEHISGNLGRISGTSRVYLGHISAYLRRRSARRDSAISGISRVYLGIPPTQVCAARLGDLGATLGVADDDGGTNASLIAARTSSRVSFLRLRGPGTHGGASSTAAPGSAVTRGTGSAVTRGAGALDALGSATYLSAPLHVALNPRVRGEATVLLESGQVLLLWPLLLWPLLLWPLLLRQRPSFDICSSPPGAHAPRGLPHPIRHR